jgi:hypothetical protein
MAAYHITHASNIPVIASKGYLSCDSGCSRRGVVPVSIADQPIKAARTAWPVTRARGGTVADYVPFYLAPRSPMLYVISKGYVAGYSGGQAEVAHLWNDTDIDGDRKRRRQAELLIVDSVPFTAVQQIGVMTESVAEQVRQALSSAVHQPLVVVRQDWYY